MTTQLLNERLQTILANVSVNFSTLTDQTHFRNDLGLDSLDVTDLLIQVEAGFGLTIPDEDWWQFQTVGQLKAYLTGELTTASPPVGFTAATARHLSAIGTGLTITRKLFCNLFIQPVYPLKAMMTTHSPLSVSLSATTLMTDYGRWLDFVMTARRTIRWYDRHLARIARSHADLSDLSNYLRGCMHQRSQFFGNLTLQLTGCVAQLRAEPMNEALIRRLTQARPAMQALMTRLEAAFAELNEEYRQLVPVAQNGRHRSLTPSFYQQQSRS